MARKIQQNVKLTSQIDAVQGATFTENSDSDYDDIWPLGSNLLEDFFENKEASAVSDSTPSPDTIIGQQNFPTPLPMGEKTKAAINPLDLDCRVILETIDYLPSGSENTLQSFGDTNLENIQNAFENNANTNWCRNDNASSLHSHERELCIADSVGELLIEDCNDIDIKDVTLEVEYHDEMNENSNSGDQNHAEQELMPQGANKHASSETKSAHAYIFDKEIRIVLSRVEVNGKAKVEKRSLRPRGTNGMYKPISVAGECIATSNCEEIPNDPDSDFILDESDDDIDRSNDSEDDDYNECSDDNEMTTKKRKSVDKNSRVRGIDSRNAKCHATDKNTRYTCSLCGKSYCDKKGLQRHEKEIHSEAKLYPCQICHSKFKRSESLRHHINTAHSKDNNSKPRVNSAIAALQKKEGFIYPCRECPEKFNFIYKLRLHLWKEHPEKADVTYSYGFKCKKCVRRFKTADGCHKHEGKMHKGDDDGVNEIEMTENSQIQYTCSLCSKSYLNIKSLRVHKRVIHGNAQVHPCKICDAKFNCKNHLRRHINTVHCDDFNFPCDRCDKKFKLRYRLKEHQRIHEGERILIENDKGTHFQCSVCNQSFKKEDSQHFVQHMLFHMNEFRFKCKICEESFATNVYLEEHYKENHKDGFPCKTSGRNLSSYKRLREHIRNVHSEAISDDPSNDKRIDKSNKRNNFREYLRKKEGFIYPCRECPEKFNFQYKLRLHLRKFHPESIDVTLSYGFKCKNCGRKFKTADGCHRHELRMHSENDNWIKGVEVEENRQLQNPCSLCSRSYRNKYHLKRHIKDTHDGTPLALIQEEKNSKKKETEVVKDHGKRFRCSLCEKSYGYLHGLQRHQERIHKIIRRGRGKHSKGMDISHYTELKFSCDKCSEKFAKSYQLRNHIRKVHESERLIMENDKGTHLQCSVCNQSFEKQDSRYFVEHMLFHKNENPFKCEICKENFPTKVYLEEHNKENHYDGFLCNICGKKLSNIHNLKIHMTGMHSEERFVCELCGETFKNNQILRRHILSHGERNLECKICGKKFKVKDALRCHFRRAHTKEGKRCVTCEYCGVTLVNIGSYKKHVRSHTGEKPYECDLCQEKFQRLPQLKTHKRKLHNFEKLSCKTCGKQFYGDANLNAHVRLHTGEKPYKCNFCDKCFSRNDNFETHMRFHTGEKPYKCPNAKCGKYFSRKDNLNVHVRKCQNK